MTEPERSPEKPAVDPTTEAPRPPAERSRRWVRAFVDYAGLAFHSPNMEVTHRFGLRRHATVTDQEAIATLVFSGCYLGFLPDHYAATFVRDGLIQRVPHAQCMYTVQFLAVTRHAHKGSRAAQAFRDVLMRAHAENLEGPGAGG